jgi:hypothetical protein
MSTTRLFPLPILGIRSRIACRRTRQWEILETPKKKKASTKFSKKVIRSDSFSLPQKKKKEKKRIKVHHPWLVTNFPEREQKTNHKWIMDC